MFKKYFSSIFLLFIGLSLHAQIDYKALEKNIEEITVKTDLDSFFEGIPPADKYHIDGYADERFLRFYGVPIAEFKVKENWDHSLWLTLTPFDSKENLDKISAKLTKLFDDPIVETYGDFEKFRWKMEGKEIILATEIEEGVFSKFREIEIKLEAQ